MPTLLRNVVAVLAGVVVGSVVNMALISVSPLLVPPSAGVDVTSPESIARAMPLFEPRHFLMPFLAHAIGTLTGAIAAWLIAATHRTQIALVIGIVFLCGGIAASFMIPAPVWFVALDILLAYLPMAWLGSEIGARVVPATPVARHHAA